MDEQEKITRGFVIAKVLNLGCHKSHPTDKNSITYDTSWGTKTALGLYETLNRILTDNIEDIKQL